MSQFPLLKTLASNLKKARKIKNFSQAKLAELIGVSTPFLGEIEIARKAPSFDTLVLLAQALDLKPYELLLDEDLKNSQFARELLTENVIQDIAKSVAGILDAYRTD